MTDALSTEQVALYLEASCALVDAELAALGVDASWHCKDGEWCANEVVGHLIEAEKRGFAGRVRGCLARDGAPTTPWDQRAVARERKDCVRVAQSLWMEFMGVRHDSVALVRSLRAGDLERSCVHPKVGVLRVRDLLHEWVHHDRNHARQLLAIAQERVWPYLGNAQGFAGE